MAAAVGRSVGQAIPRLALVVLALAQSLSALGWRANYLPASASALALSGGGRALPGSATLSMVNPAHLWGSRAEELELGYLRMFGGLVGYGIRWHGASRDRPTELMLRSLVEDDLELRSTVPTAEPLALFSARMLSATLMRGWPLGNTRLGLGLTVAYQRVFEYAGRGVWLSAGWQGELLPWLRWGLTVSSLGLGETLVPGGKAEVLQAAGAGLAIKTPLWGSYLALDLAWEPDRGAVPTVAWQTTGSILQLALSIRWGGDAPLLAAGFQWEYRRWVVAYAYAYQSSALGQPHMITLKRRL